MWSKYPDFCICFHGLINRLVHIWMFICSSQESSVVLKKKIPNWRYYVGNTLYIWGDSFCRFLLKHYFYNQKKKKILPLLSEIHSRFRQNQRRNLQLKTLDEPSYWVLPDKSSESAGSYYFVLYKCVSFNFNKLVFPLVTTTVNVVKISRLLYLFSLSNKWTCPHFSVYLFLIERQCGLEKNTSLNY